MASIHTLYGRFPWHWGNEEERRHLQAVCGTGQISSSLGPSFFSVAGLGRVVGVFSFASCCCNQHYDQSNSEWTGFIWRSLPDHGPSLKDVRVGTQAKAGEELKQRPGRSAYWFDP